MNKTTNKRELGKYGEELASQFLTEKGYKIVTANYRCRYGEIDLIAEKDNCLVFVEVKLRRNTLYGLPVEAVNRKKQKTICTVTEIYIAENNIRDKDIRFDVIEVYDFETISINHIENAFESRG